MEKTVCFSDVVCCLSYLEFQYVESGWKWKVNPYLLETSVKKKNDIYIDMSGVTEGKNIQETTLINEKRAGFYRHIVQKQEDQSTLWKYIYPNIQKTMLCFEVSKNWDKISLIEDNTETVGNLAFEYLGQIMPSVLLKHDILTFHGVLVEYNGYGVIISADSGVGKTTRARIWRDSKNALIINGDRATCQKTNGVWTGYGLPWSGTSGEQINRSVPLKALVVLERGEENEVCKMSLKESFGAVLPHVLCSTWDAELVGKAMEQMDDFLKNVPVLYFKSRPDEDAIEALCKALEEL